MMMAACGFFSTSLWRYRSMSQDLDSLSSVWSIWIAYRHAIMVSMPRVAMTICCAVQIAASPLLSVSTISSADTWLT